MKHQVVIDDYGTLNKTKLKLVSGEYSQLYKYSSTISLFPVIKITMIFIERHWQCQFHHVFIIIIICFQIYFNKINIVNSLNKIWYRHYNQQDKCTRACEPSKIDERFISHSSSWIRILWNIKYYHYNYSIILLIVFIYYYIYFSTFSKDQ